MDTNTATVKTVYDRPARAGDYGYAVRNDNPDSDSPDEPEYQEGLAKVTKATTLIITRYELYDLQRMAQEKVYLAACVEAVNSFNSRSTEYVMSVVLDDECCGGHFRIAGVNNDFVSEFGDVNAFNYGDDYDPFSILLQVSPQVAKDWACWTYSQAHPQANVKRTE